MANTKKYISLDKLGVYDELIKAKISADDATALATAKSYADGLAKNYEAAGSVATAKTEMTSYVDGKVTTLNASIAEVKTQADKGVADAAIADGKAVEAKTAADAAQADVDALEAYVGTIPEGYTESNVIAYVNKKAQETLDAASGGSSESAASVLAALNTYKAENDPKVSANTTAAANAQTAAEAAQASADAAQDSVDELAGKVGTVPTDKTVVQMIADAQTAATYDDTQVKADIKANSDAIAEEKARMDAFMTLNEGETLNQALDSLKEIQDYITSEAADADILVGKVSALEGIVDGIGGEGESATVVAYVTSAIEALKIGDYAKAADLTALTERMVSAESKITTLEGSVATKAEKTYVDSAVETLEGADEALSGRIANLEAAVGESGSVSEDIATAKSEAIATAAEDATAKANKALEDAKKYADDEDAKIETRVAKLETDSATHALASDLTTLAGRVTTAETDISTLKTEMDAVEALAAANKLAHEANAKAIELKADKTALDAVSARVTTLENWHSNFTEVSEEEINGLFTA